MKNKNNKNIKPTHKPSKLLQKNIFLYLTEFFSGIAVMAVELGASRLLSPYFSSSQIVWTIIIGTIMIAMALGNIYGGRSADRNPNPDILYGRILVAGVWIALIPVLGKYIIVGLSGLIILSVNSMYLVWAALASAFAVFVFPLFLLGTVTPSLVKYSVQSLSDSGKTVGYLGAFNTIGSIIGTFLPTFVTIPAVGTAITFLIFAGLLIAIAIIYFISVSAGRVRSVIAALIFIFSCIMGHSDSFAFWNTALTYEGESIYNYLQVSEDDSTVSLSTNVLFGVQSIKKKDGRLSGMYYDYALAAPLMCDDPSSKLDILILGNGSGTFAAECKNFLPDVNIDGVEIDGKITDLARKYFDMPSDVKVTTYDGRAYLKAIDKKYDVIMVDAYQDISVPFQMASTEFFNEVNDHLKENGVMVINMNMRGETEDSINAYLSDTISTVFENVYTVDVNGWTNRELFASNSNKILENLINNSTNILSNDVSSENDIELAGMMTEVYDSLKRYEPGDRILTDDKAPVEVLSMMALDEMIQYEVIYYKDIYKEKGLKGLLEEI